jgi:hypothetical protein
LIFNFVHRKMDWAQATAKYPIVTVSEEEGEEAKAPTAAGEGATTIVNTGRGRFNRPT